MATRRQPTPPGEGLLPGTFPIDLNALFAAMSDIVVVIDRTGKFVWSAPTIPATRDGAWERNEWLPGKSIHEAIRDAGLAARMLDAVQRALDTAETQHLEYHLTVFGDETWLAAAVSKLSDDLVLWVARDITERIKSQRILEERVNERTRELSALLGTSRAISSAITFRTLVGVILDEVKTVIDYTGASVLRLDGEVGEVFESRGPTGREDDLIGLHVTFPFDLDWLAPIRRNVPVVIDDTHGDTPEARGIRHVLRAELASPSLSYVRAFMIVPLAHEDTIIGVLTMSKDQPGFFTDDHVRLATAVASHAAIASANATLFEETERTARERAVMLEVSRAVASKLELQPLLETILDQLRNLVPYAGASVNLVEGDMMRQVVVRRPRGTTVTPEDTQRTFSIERMNALLDRVNNGRAYLIDDVHGDSDDAIDYRGMYGGDLKGTPVEYVRAFLNVPLVARGRVLGVLSIADDEPGFFTQRHVELVSPLADQAAVAIDNARLYEEARSSARETAALLEVSRAVASSLDIGEVITAVLDQLSAIIENTGSSLLLIKDGAFEMTAARSLSPATAEIGARIPLELGSYLWDHFGRGESVIIADVQDEDDAAAAAYRESITAMGRLDQPPFNAVRSWMGVPLIHKDDLIGMVTLSWTKPNYFTEEHARLARAFADQAAIAIENARLYEHGQSLAALEERQRLARELHDSVSQALYGIALGARAARTQLGRDTAKVAEPLEYVLSLAEAGLAEMRALIFELRPDSLETEGLVAAIIKQASAVKVRYGIEVDFPEPDEPETSLDVKEAAYRVTQEALNNVVKHSKATRVSIALGTSNGTLALSVTDDGTGFDPSADYAGHLGLKSMRERAERAGGKLTINSAPGKGSTISLELPVRR